MRDPLPWNIAAGLASLFAVICVVVALRLRRKNKVMLPLVLTIVPLAVALGAWTLAGMSVQKRSVDLYAVNMESGIEDFIADRDRTPVFKSADWKKPVNGPNKKSGEPYADRKPKLFSLISSTSGLKVTSRTQLELSAMVVYIRNSKSSYDMYSVSYRSRCASKKKQCPRLKNEWRVCKMADALSWWRPADCSYVTRTTSSEPAKASAAIRGLRVDKL